MRKVWSKSRAPYGGRYFIANTQNWRKRKVHYATWTSIQFCKHTEWGFEDENQPMLLPCRTAMFGCFAWTQLETQTKPGWRTAPSRPSHLRRGRLLRFRSSNAAHISTAQYDGCSGMLVQLSSYSCTICKGQRYLRVCTKQSLSIYILVYILGIVFMCMVCKSIS